MDEQEKISDRIGTPKFAKAWILSSVKISPELYNKMKLHHISISEATRVGVSLMLADIGEMNYDNNLNLMRRIELIRLQLEAKSNELEFLKEKERKLEDGTTEQT